jgi:hypothetical protein
MKKLEILAAHYGVLVDAAVDVTEKLQALARDERLELPGGYFSYNDLFGDPAPDRHKQLQVAYEVSEVTELSTYKWFDKMVIFEEDQAFYIDAKDEVEANDGYFYNGEDPIKLEDL